MAAVCDHLAARAAGGEAAAEDEGGQDMQEAALRVALDSFALSALQHDFGARRYGPCEVLQVGAEAGAALPTLWPFPRFGAFKCVLHGLARLAARGRSASVPHSSSCMRVTLRLGQSAIGCIAWPHTRALLPAGPAAAAS